MIRLKGYDLFYMIGILILVGIVGALAKKGGKIDTGVLPNKQLNFTFYYDHEYP